MKHAKSRGRSCLKAGIVQHHSNYRSKHLYLDEQEMKQSKLSSSVKIYKNGKFIREEDK